MSTSLYFENKLLLAMPSMADTRFERSVIYLCSHDASGAMGIVINEAINQLNFGDLLEQLSIEITDTPPELLVHAGGPVEPGRGFVSSFC